MRIGKKNGKNGVFWLPCVALAGLCLAPGQLAWAGQSAHLQRVKVSSQNGHTRIKLALDRATKFRYFALSNPSRLVVDLSHTGDGAHKVERKGGRGVRKVRFGKKPDGRLRVVFDLAGKVPSGFKPASGKGASLVLDLAGAGAHVSKSMAQKHTQPTARTASFQAVPQAGPVVVVVDPGHGGSDDGATGPNGLHEKTATLRIAKILEKELDATPGIKAHLTRTTDKYVSLRHRVRFALDHHANLFISIHENSFRSPSVRGGTCYALSRHGATSATARQVARTENSADHSVGGVDFSNYSHSLNTVLTDLFQTSAMNAGIHLGEAIIKEFAKVEPIYDSKVQRANFSVLRDPMIPSVLCETAFLSNPTQARKLRHHHFRTQLANAIYQGIINYLHQYSTMRIASGSPKAYVVKSGDTLSGIAAQFNVGVKRIKHANNLQSSALQVGEHLTIPPAKQIS